MTKRSVTVAVLAALALLVGCSSEQEEQIEEELPVAAPAPEITAPIDTTDSIPPDTGMVVPVP
jgi:uncharacterized protein YcfL